MLNTSRRGVPPEVLQLKAALKHSSVPRGTGYYIHGKDSPIVCILARQRLCHPDVHSVPWGWHCQTKSKGLHGTKCYTGCPPPVCCKALQRLHGRCGQELTAKQLSPDDTTDKGVLENTLLPSDGNCCNKCFHTPQALQNRSREKGNHWESLPRPACFTDYWEVWSPPPECGGSCFHAVQGFPWQQELFSTAAFTVCNLWIEDNSKVPWLPIHTSSVRVRQRLSRNVVHNSIW